MRLDVVVAVLTVFVLGAVELWAAVPAGVALGLHPFLTAVSAALGAIVGVAAVIGLGNRARAWLARGHAASASAHPSVERIWIRFGVVGLGLAAPLLVGAVIGTALGLALGAPVRRLLVSMVIGIVAWTAILVSAAALGLAGLDAAT